MMKKLLIFLIIILSSSSLIYGANCYSSATVINNTSIRIVDSKDALISIPKDLTLKSNESESKVTEEDNNQAVKLPNIRTIETKIKNNLGEKIWVKVDNGDITSKDILAEPDFGVPIDPGQEIMVTINLNNGYKGKDVVFHARWHGNACTAEIKSSIIGEIKS